MRLLSFQERGVEFLLNAKRSAYLGDDMGLGKTVQVAAALEKLHLPPVIVVCPASVVFGWEHHLKRVGYTPRIVGGGKPEFGAALIVSYHRYTSPKFRDAYKKWFEEERPVVVLDEAHYLKTPGTQRVRKMLGPSTLFRFATRIWLLSGTPITNRPMDMFPVLAAFRPDTIAHCPTRHEFGMRYCDGFLDAFGWNFKGGSNLGELADILQGWMLRRTKEEVLTELPDLVVSEVPLDIPVDDLDDSEYLATRRADLAAAKASKISDYCKLKLVSCNKLVIFAYHKDLIEAIHTAMSEYRPVQLHGGCNTQERRQALDVFQNDPGCRVFIGQINAAGQGVDGLQNVCNYMVFAEPDWSPAQISQAIDRLRRIGQSQGTVFADVLVARRTLDRTVMAVSQKKRHIINQVIKGDNISMANHISIETALERLVLATERLVQIAESAMAEESAPVEEAVKEVAAQVVEAKVEKPKVKKKAEPVEQVLESKPAVSRKDVEQAAQDFIGTGADAEERHGLIVNVIFPKLGYENLASIPESEYEYLVEMLKLGPDAYRDAPKPKLSI